MENNGFVYIISCGDAYKIGVAKNPEHRLRQLQTGNSEELLLEYTEGKINPYAVEKELHRSLQKYRTKGEWFKGLSFNDIRIALMLVTEYD